MADSPTAPPPQRLYDFNFALAVGVALTATLSWALQFNNGRMYASLGATVQWASVLTTLPIALVLPLWPYLGTWLDRTGMRRLQAAGLALTAVCAATFALAGPLGVGAGAFLFQTGVFLGISCYFVGMAAYVAKMAPAHRRSEAVGSMGLGGFVGMMLSSPVAQALLGDSPGIPGYQRLLLASAAIGLLSAGLTLLLRRTPADPEPEPMRWAQPWQVIGRHWPGRRVLFPLAISVCFLGNSVFVALHCSQLGVPNTWFFIIWPALAIVSRIALWPMLIFLGDRWLGLLGTLVYAAAWPALALAEPGEPAWVAVSGALAGIGHGLAFPCMVNHVAGRLPIEQRGLGTSLALGLPEAGKIALGPILGGVADSFGQRWMFVLMGILTAALAWLGLATLRGWTLGSARLGSTSNPTATLPAEAVSSSERTRHEAGGPA